MRILVVDDHPMICDGLTSYITEAASNTLSEAVTVKSVYSLRDAQIELSGIEKYDLVFLDLNLDDENRSTTTLERVQETNKHEARIVIFTGLPLSEPETAQILRRCVNGLGANYILPKSTNHEVMFKGLPRILAGEVWMSTEVLNILLNAPGPASKPCLDLTNRQWDVARGISRGLRNKQIANELSLSEGNVRQLVSAIYRRVGVHSRIAVSNRIQAASM